MTEKTLVFLKPDAVVRRYVGARVLDELLDEYDVAHFQVVDPDREFIAGEHYPQHEGKFFFEWLVDFVDAAPLIVTILRGEDVIDGVRERLGDTIPQEADPRSLRGRYGTYGGLNVAHASDSPQNAATEIDRWRPILEGAAGSASPVARDYVEQYLNYPTIDPVRYRELTERVIEGELEPEPARDHFAHLLSKESDAPVASITRLADVMVENALLDRE